MDPERVRAYLQVACAGLGFDIGEVWYTSTESGSSSIAAIEEHPSDTDNPLGTESGGEKKHPQKRIKFLQLYTSKSYDDRRSELVVPPSEKRSSIKNKSATAAAFAAAAESEGFKPLERGNSILSPDELKKHVLSPRLVDAISDSAEVVWANCEEREGLIGRSDMRLQTAVGMPVAMDNEGNMCIVVMFSPNNVQSSDDAMEYLQAISKSAVSSSIPCLFPVVEGGNRITANPPTSDGGGEGQKSAAAIHPPPGAPVHHAHKGETQDFGAGVKARFVALGDGEDAEVHNVHEVTEAPKDCYGIPMLPSFAELGSSPPNIRDEAKAGHRSSSPLAQDAFDEASFGVWSTVMSTSGGGGSSSAMQLDGPMNAAVTNSSRNSSSSTVSLMTKPMMPHHRRIRLEEFVTAFLGMSVFDAADVWIPCSGEDYDTLIHVTSVTATEKNEGLNYFKMVSEGSAIKIWSGAVGRAFGSGNPVWTANRNVFVDANRADAFARANIQTTLAVPIHSAGVVSPSCVLCCYSLVRSDSVPFVLKFVQQALRLLWEGLDRVQPHESVGRELWRDVAPADLGEMAADVEMQKAFLVKKRPHDDISSSYSAQLPESARFSSAPADVARGNSLESAALSSSLSMQLESLNLPPAEKPPTYEMKGSPPPRVLGLAPAPLLPNKVITSSSVPPPQMQQTAWAVRNQVQDAVRSMETAVPWSEHQSVATNEEGTKRAHIYSPAPTPSPPPMSQPPTHLPPMGDTSTYTSQQQGYQQQQRGPTHIGQDIPDALQPGPFPGQKQPPKEDPAVVRANIDAFNAMARKQSGGGGGIGNALRQAAQPTPAPVQSWGGVAATANGPMSDQYAPQGNGAMAPDHVQSMNDQFCQPTGPSVGISGSGSGSGPRPVVLQGNGKSCRIQGCNDFAVARRPYCLRHSGNRLCEHDGCTKCAQGSTRFCIAHGGGRRCTFPGCDKGARDKFFCAAHGGGKRCSHEGCTKSAVGGSNLCTSHGGGRRCAVEGCEKSAQSSTKFCVKHGGGKKCSHSGCEKVARGRTLYCAAHGGGVRCKLEGCNRVAIGKLQLCRAHGGGSNSRKSRKSATSTPPPPPSVTFQPF